MKNKWWQEAIIYQIYPKSFKDSNGDSIGDIRGIVEQLDYIASLGVNTLWLNPIFISPQVDDGYDISNYYAIDPLFGTLEEVEGLIEEAHKRGMKVIFDLVINHTSDQHPWFQEALKGPDNIYRDYYLWHQGTEGGGLPNNWASFFGGSVWEKDPVSKEYYFHLFDKHMPDLNWENVEVRNAMLDIAKYWLTKGIDGFRLDAFIHLQKADFSLQVEAVPEGEVALAEAYYANLPEVKVYLEEFVRSLRTLKPDLFILGEAASATESLAQEYTDGASYQCDTVVSFRYFPEEVTEVAAGVPAEWQTTALNVASFKATMASWQAHLSGERYPTLYWNNHDMPRLVSRFGDDGVFRQESAKMLATLMYLQRGIPMLLFGEEIGMKNAEITEVAAFHTPSAQGAYQTMLEHGYSEEVALSKLTAKSKEASRGAMQWDTSPYAGFSTVSPWSHVNEEAAYNVAAQEANPSSILFYYRQLLQLKQCPLFTQGSFELLPTSDETYVYRRQLGQASALVCTNLTAQPVSLHLDKQSFEGTIVLSNDPTITSGCDTLELPAYGAVVIKK